MIALVGVVVFGLGHIFSSHRTPAMTSQDITYEMPRPKAAFTNAEFDLNGREIDRNYINPFEAKKKKDAEKKAADEKKTAATVAAAAKAAKKAKEDAQKKAVADAKKKAQTKVAKKDDSDGKNSLGDFDPQTNSKNTPQGVGAAPPDDAAKTAAAAASGDNDKRSPDQWRSLISADPTKANVASLMAAYASGQVDETTVLLIVKDLLDSNKDASQSLGIYALSSVYDARSFELIVDNSGQLDATNQASANTYMSSYANGHLSALAGALQTSDDNAVTKATAIVLAGYSQAKSGGGLTQSSGTGKTSTGTTASYAQFIKIFTTLSKSSDATIANLANSALSQMQTTAVAAN